MKPLLLMALSLLILFPARGQQPSSCTVSDALRWAYRNDVKALALKRIYDLHAPDTASIDIPASYQDTIWSGLAAICNLNAQLEADSVFLHYCIHTFPQGFIPPSLEVYVDPAFSWTSHWQVLQTVTGNAPLDSLIGHYGFTVRSYWSSLHSATLVTSQAINVFAFADSLKKIPGILGVDFGYSIGTNNWIRYTRDTAQHFTFIYGWGDCPSGCTDRKVWAYTVDPAACSVKADSIYWVSFFQDPPRPHLPNCNLNPVSVPEVQAVQENIHVYPNPLREQLFIEVPGKGWNYRLLDLSGRTWLTGAVGRQPIHTAMLPPGLWILYLRSEEGQVLVRKLLHD